MTRPRAARKSHPVTAFAAWVSLALLLLPLVAVAIYSVNSARTGLVFEGFSLRWYRSLLSNRAILDATRNTLFLAAVSTAISTMLGTMLALGLERIPWSRRTATALDTIVDLPVVSPDILFAAALVVAFRFLREISPRFEPGMTVMVIGHVTFQVSFVALVVRSRLQIIGRTLSEASHDLNATAGRTFLRVTLPLLLPAIAAGAMLAFTLSLDDFVISFFTAGPKSGTIPILVYSSLRRGLSPEVHALSTLIVLATMALVAGLGLTTRLARRN